MYQGHRDIATQDEFNKAVSHALYQIYGVTVISPNTIAAGEPEAVSIRDQADIDLRAELANIQNYAFREEYAKLAEDGSAVMSEAPAPA